MSLTLKTLTKDFSLLQLDGVEHLRDLMQAHTGFISLSCSADEISLICPTDVANALPPQNVLSSDHGWSCLKIAGPLAFSESGILEKVLRPLAGSGISVVVCGTFNTDYILVKKELLQKACQTLEDHLITVEY